jgi:hypothetical protein
MMHKAQQLRIATALAGQGAPPNGAGTVRQADAKPRHDRIHSDAIAPHGKPPREDLVTTRQLDRAAKARKASSSVTGSGGGDSASASGPKESLRAEIRSAMER